MVNDFALDYMHLFLPGMQKQLLKLWMKGTSNFKVKFTSHDMKTISDNLLKCNDFLPHEIHCKIRSLEVISFWKATEFRTFLLKTGPVVLQNILSPEVYNHFILLHCAITICSCELFLKYIRIAEQLFEMFVETFPEIYGPENVTYTVHNITHVIADVKRFGTLDAYSAFPFESMLGQIKSLLRSGNKPLQQVAKRIMEKEGIVKEATIQKKGLQLFVEDDHALPNCKGVYLKIILNNMMLSSSRKNMWILTNSNDLIKIINFTKFENETYIWM